MGTDRQGAVDMIRLHVDKLSTVQKVIVDGGYSGENFAQGVKEIRGAEVEVMSLRGARGAVSLAMHCIVAEARSRGNLLYRLV
jgi:hypothetical protein